MSKKLHKVAAVLTLLTLVACGGPLPTKATLVYETVPVGAELFEGNQSLGMAPILKTYTGDPKVGKIETPDVKAVWPSGASTTFYTVLDLGTDRTATLERPKNAPGLQQDLDHAKQVEAVSKAEAARIKALDKAEIARNSQRCKNQMQAGNKGMTDDCA